MRAYDLKLVKRIEVDAILDEPDFNKPFIEVKSIKATKSNITAKLVIDVDDRRRAEAQDHFGQQERHRPIRQVERASRLSRLYRQRD